MSRIISFDILKGMSMYLVIFTHCLQYVANQTFENILFQIIYVFHMPLFILISGYLFSKKINKPLKHIIVDQFTHLIIPTFVLGGIVRLLLVGSVDIKYLIKLPALLWFLLTLFICSVSYAVMYRVTHRIGIIVILLSLLTLCIPSGLYFIKFFMPFFGIGLLFSNMDVYNRINIGSKGLLLSLMIIIIFYVLLWDTSYYVYITFPPFILSSDLNLWIAYFMRLVFGTLITLFLMCLFKKQQISGIVIKVLVRFSYNSLYLYIIHFVFLTSISDKIFINFNSEFLTDLTILIGSAILTIVLSLFIDLLRTNKYTKTLILADFK